MSILTVQTKLKAAGFDPGPLDGAWGDQTEAAIQAALGHLAPSSGGGLRPSPAIANFIKSYEKCRLNAYMPTPNDKPTIGWGSTGSDIKLGMTWTQAQADARFASDLMGFGAAVLSAIGPAPTTQDQYDAMVSLAYNIGIGGFRDSTLLKLHRAGDYAGAKAQFGRWNKQAGVVLNGLTARRAGEAAIYGRL